MGHDRSSGRDEGGGASARVGAREASARASGHRSTSDAPEWRWREEGTM